MNRHPITLGSIRHSTFGFRPSPLLALRGIVADFGPEHADTFRRDLHPDLRLSRHSETTPDADFILAKPPFINSDWFRKVDRNCYEHSARSLAA
jgi:hypothetical protein